MATPVTPKPPDNDPRLGPGQIWTYQKVGANPLTGAPIYDWIPDYPPKYIADPTGANAASTANAAERNAIDSAHYSRADAEQALRDAADALYQRGQLGNNLYSTQGQIGQNLLDTVSKLALDPSAGPLGLSAFAKYGGGAQHIASATGGQGIVNPYGGLMDTLLSSLSGAVGPNTEFNRVNAGGLTTDYSKIDPNKAPAMTPEAAAQAPDNRQALIDAWGAFNPGKTLGVDEGVKYPPQQAGAATGGSFRLPGYAEGTDGLTLGGEPHFITDSKGNKVAAITEDGKPETVSGIPGGVEVTPEDPQRKQAYMEAKQAGSLLGDMLGRVLYPENQRPSLPPQPTPPGLATGGTAALFPSIPGSPVNGGGQEIPTAGGPADAAPVGPSFHPTTEQPLPTEAMAPDFQTRLKGYAKLLGAALSNTTAAEAIPVEAKRALNAGAAPQQLLTAQALSTLAPSQRSNYFGLLSQMGLGSPQDIQAQIAAGRPASMTGGGGGRIGG